MSKEIEQAINELLAAKGVSFKAIFVRATTRDDKWVCDQWDVGFEAAKSFKSFEYFTGTGLRKIKFPVSFQGNSYGPNSFGQAKPYIRQQIERLHSKPVAPSAASVLYSLVLDASALNEDFDEWCSNYGYDNDSIKASKLFEACRDNARKLKDIFDKETREKLEELLQDY